MDWKEIVNRFNGIIRVSKNNRGEHKITQRKISEKTGITPAQISHMLSGEADMYLRHACAIAAAIGAEIILKTTDGEKLYKDPKTELDDISARSAKTIEENNSVLREHLESLRDENKLLREQNYNLINKILKT